MRKKNILVFVAGAILTLAMLFLAVPFSTACPFLECANFTGQDHEDCLNVLSQGFNEDEEQQLLCTFWDYNYGWKGYQPPDYPIPDVDLSLDYNEIDTSRFILASKIILFILFNYFLYCVIVKPKWGSKWLTAV